MISSAAMALGSVSAIANSLCLGKNRGVLMTEERITELEIKIAYQEDLLQSLNIAVSDQQQQISRLEESCMLLNERMKAVADNQGINQGVEIPPHY